jgi:hypothetical protein
MARPQTYQGFAGEFLDLVQRMRAAQKTYFSERSPGTLAESKRLEREVDRLIERETGPRAEPMLWDRHDPQ